MKVTLFEDIVINKYTEAWWIKDNGEEPAFISIMPNIAELQSRLKCECVDIVRVYVGTQQYMIACDDMGRLSDRPPTALDRDENVVLVGSLIVMPYMRQRFLDSKDDPLGNHVRIGHVAGRFSDKDISDVENAYFLTDVKIIRSEADEIEVQKEIGGHWFPRWMTKRKARKAQKKYREKRRRRYYD